MLILELLKGQIDIASFIIFGLAIVLGITLHEFAHALAAEKLGDPTPRLLGRLTLNPLSHLDPIGTIMIFLIGIGFGKPTPFDHFNLRNVKRDSAIISVAGAVANIIMAVVLSLPYLIAFLTNHVTPLLTIIYSDYISIPIYLNIILAIFNLIPIAPLDGFKVLGGLLPKDWYLDWQQMERYGPVILIFLLLLNFTGWPIITMLIFIPSKFILSILLPGLLTIY